MKEFKVYFLKDTAGEIVYVGMTSMTLKQRLVHHIAPSSKYFPNRKDLSIELFDTYKTKEDAAHIEGVLKYHLGFRDKIITDGQYSGSKSGKLLFENKKGLFDPKNKEKCLQGNRKAGNIAKTSGRLEIMLKKAQELRCQRIHVYTTNGQFIGEYKSQTQAADELVLLQSKISLCLSGHRKSHGGFIFKLA